MHDAQCRYAIKRLYDRTMSRTYRIRWVVTLFIVLCTVVVPLVQTKLDGIGGTADEVQKKQTQAALDLLAALPVKGRAPKTGYTRTQFGDGWALVGLCDTRNLILARDLVNARVSKACKVMSGTLHDPYTAKDVLFERGATTSDLVQIDHVVALSNAWQTGAQLLTAQQRESFANDPLNLLAVDGQANQDKSDGDAATWLPPNKLFRCQYVARQISVKTKYSLWVTPGESVAMRQVLQSCV